MMALAGVELETLVSEPDALTTRPPQLAEGEIRKSQPHKIISKKQTTSFISFNLRALCLLISFKTSV